VGLHANAFQSATPLVFMSFSWLVMIGILISASVFLSSNVSAQEQTNAASNKIINVTNTKFSIQYNNTGDLKVLSVKPDVQAKSLVINIQAAKEGLLTVTLPRELIDDKDRGADSPFFFVIGGYISGDAKENSKTPTQRIITIPFIAGTHVIVITGTQIVPEFGEMAPITLAVMVVLSIFVLSTRNKLTCRS